MLDPSRPGACLLPHTVGSRLSQVAADGHRLFACVWRVAVLWRLVCEPGTQLLSRRVTLCSAGEKLRVMTLLYFPTNARGRLSPDCSCPRLSWWCKALAPSGLICISRVAGAVGRLSAAHWPFVCSLWAAVWEGAAMQGHRETWRGRGHSREEHARYGIGTAQEGTPERKDAGPHGEGQGWPPCVSALSARNETGT